MNENTEVETKPAEYVCKPCKYKTLRSFDLERHYKSKLHERNGQPKTKNAMNVIILR
jgi:hypothetical protein